MKSDSVFRDILKYVPVKVVPGLAGLACIYMLAKNLTPGEYAIYSTVLAISIIFVQICGTWMANAIQYYLPNSNDYEQGRLISQAFGFQAILAFLFGLVAAGIVHFLTGTSLLAIFSFLLVVFQSINSLTQASLQSLKNIKIQIICVLVQSLSWILVLASALLFFRGNSVVGVGAITVSNIIAGSVGCYFLFGIINANTKSAFVLREQTVKKMLKYGVPMGFWFFAIQVFTIGDRIIYPIFGVEEGIGQYMTFRDVALGLTGFLTMPILMAVHPTLMLAWKGGNGVLQVESILIDCVELVLLLMFPVLIGVCLLGTDLMVFFFGHEYRSNGLSMVLAYISIMALTLSVYFQKGLEVTANTMALAKIAVCVALAFVPISLVAIANFGVIGGASAVCLCSIMYLIAVLKYACCYVRIKLKKKFLLKIVMWSALVVLIDFNQNLLFDPIFNENEKLWQRVEVIVLAGLILLLSDYKLNRQLARLIRL